MTKVWKGGALGVLAMLVLVLTVGCAGWKAVDTTLAVHDLTAAESNVTYQILPAFEGLDPELQDKLIAIPTVPGKNVHFKWYNPDGTLKMELDTERSVVIESLLSGAQNIDAEKFLEDERIRAWVTAEREAWMGALLPLVNQYMSRTPVPDDGQPPAWFREFIELYKQQTKPGG